MKKQVEYELNNLNNDFDKCYNIYTKKLKELKDIEVKMSSPLTERRRNWSLNLFSNNAAFLHVIWANYYLCWTLIIKSLKFHELIYQIKHILSS